MNLKCQTFLIKYVRINLYNSIPYTLEFTAIQYTKSITALLLLLLLLSLYVYTLFLQMKLKVRLDKHIQMLEIINEKNSIMCHLL